MRHRRAAARRSRRGRAARLTIIGAIVSGVAIGGLPDANDRVVTVVDALGDLQNGTQIPPGRLAAQVAWLGDHTVLPIAGAVLVALGALLAVRPARLPVPRDQGPQPAAADGGDRARAPSAVSASRSDASPPRPAATSAPRASRAATTRRRSTR